MTETEQRAIALNFIEGLRTRNGALLSAILAPDVVWSLPGQSVMSGEAHGVDGILARAETLGHYGAHIEVEHVVFGYRDVALHLHNTGQRGDHVLDEHLTTVCHLRDGRIQRLDTFISDVPMLNAYFQ